MTQRQTPKAGEQLSLFPELTDNNFKGELAGFPPEVVATMLDRQEQAGNERSLKPFEADAFASDDGGGFDWDDTPEGEDFWYDVIHKRDFDLFFAKYPKQ